MTDITERLRNGAALIVIRHNETGASDLFVEAAGEIDQLRARIAELEERLKSAQGAMRAHKEREREAFDSAFGSEAIMREIVHAVDDAATLAGARTAVAEIYRSDRAARGRAELEAQRVPDEFADVMRAVFAEMEARDGHRGNAPGHAHEVPGIWDDDNGDLAGQPCAWCALWNKAAAMLAAAQPAQERCWCETCRPVSLADMRMVLCPDCGNKRCPRATNHTNACTGSNKPGQPGSAYAGQPAPSQGEDA